MVEEYDSIIRSSVWEVVPRLVYKSVVSSRWIYKIKQEAYGSVEKHKARFVARGFSRVEGIYYNETSPILRYSSIRSILAVSVQMGWKIHQMDVKTTLLNDMIEEEVYSDENLINSCKEDLAREFKLKDLGLMHYFLGMEVLQGDEELFISQGKYANKILKKFHIESSKPMETPLASNWMKEDATSYEVVEATIYRQLVGSLMYLVNT
eukprot:PITA_07719